MISVFTPTYQRRKLVENLKISLDNQTDFDFEWIVVDDGSSDGTEEYFRTIKSEKYPIKYFKQNNSGKHIAHNKAATEAKGDLFICVDSDDELFPNAIHTINEINYKYRNIQDCIGYVFPRTSDSFNDKNAWNIVDGSKLDIIDTKEIYGIIETAIVLKLDFVKRHLFPQFENQSGGGYEKFLPESVLYNQLVKDGKFYAINNEIYKSDYHDDGITKNLYSTWLNNCNGVDYSLRLKYDFLSKYGFKRRFISRAKCMVNLIALRISSNRSLLEDNPSLLYTIALYIPSFAFSKKRFK